jgi:hypothetical protein
MSRIHLFGNYYLGTGLITVVGTSFATLSTANAVRRIAIEFAFTTEDVVPQIFDAMYADGTCPSTTGADGTVMRGACPDAYGYLLGPPLFVLWSRSMADRRTGTSLVCSFLEIGMSFVRPRLLQRVFPPIVTGTVILLIGTSLVGSSGILNWGGGSNGCASRPSSGFFELCPNIAAPRPLPYVFASSCHTAKADRLMQVQMGQP